jgi:hypothetical protein
MTFQYGEGFGRDLAVSRALLRPAHEGGSIGRNSRLGVHHHPEETAMSFTTDLWETPPDLSRASQWTAMNGYIYLSFGALVVIWRSAVQTLFRDEQFAGHEEALFRVIGMTVMVIGWLYLFGGRSGGRQTVVASIVDRWTLVPVVLVPIAVAGLFPHVFLAFALLDSSLALGAWILRRGSYRLDQAA